MPRHRKERGRTLGTPRREGGPITGTAGASSRGRERFRLARSLMMTPWFAAGAGIVIAAAMAVDSQAALTYAPSTPSVRCSVSGCARPAGMHPPDLATARPGVALKTPGTEAAGARAASSGKHPGAGVGHQLGFRVIRHWHSGFVAMITMPGDLKPGPWRLEFAFPWARIDRVWGARWQPTRNGDGGTALGPWPVEPWQRHGRGGPDARQLKVWATGKPTDPSGCRLDGIRCRYG